MTPSAPSLPAPSFPASSPASTTPVSSVGTSSLVTPPSEEKPDSSFIYDTSISALQGADSYLNDQTVQVTGEVIEARYPAAS